MKVSIAKIRPNPFQVRKHIDRVKIEALAHEIKALGFWAPLRAREVDGHYELCYGHRRYEALKHLKWKEVDIDIVKLSDDDMAVQALVENLQREGLADTEKAEGITRLITRFIESEHLTIDSATNRVAMLMGLSSGRVLQIRGVKNLGKKSQRLIEQRAISGAVAQMADRIGGDEMVETAVEHGLSHHTLIKIGTELGRITEPTIRERVRKAVIAGKVRDPEAVREQARKVSRKVEEHSGKRPPPDLLIVIRAWTKTMHAWAKKLDEVQPYLNYIESEPDTANEFKAATRELIDKLKRFL